MSTEENKAIVRRLLEEVWSEGKFDVINEIVDNDWIPEDPELRGSPRNGTHAERLFAKSYRHGLPDLEYTITQMIAEGDTVVAQWTAKGTHMGEINTKWGVIPPTSHQVSSWALGLFRVTEGRIKEREVYWQGASLLRKLWESKVWELAQRSDQEGEGEASS